MKTLFKVGEQGSLATPTYINHRPKGFEAEVLIGQLPFLSPIKQH